MTLTAASTAAVAHLPLLYEPHHCDWLPTYSIVGLLTRCDVCGSPPGDVCRKVREPHSGQCRYAVGETFHHSEPKDRFHEPRRRVAWVQAQLHIGHRVTYRCMP